MPIFGLIILLFAVIFPRAFLFALWLLTDWFNGMFANWLAPLLGFIFMPYTLLWYTLVFNVLGNSWGPIEFVLMVLAIAADLSAWGWFGDRGDHVHEVVHH